MTQFGGEPPSSSRSVHRRRKRIAALHERIFRISAFTPTSSRRVRPVSHRGCPEHAETTFRGAPLRKLCPQDRARPAAGGCQCRGATWCQARGGGHRGSHTQKKASAARRPPTHLR